jgi:hypothetical protein
MANIIKPKRSNTASAVPTTGQLASGELAVNMADQKVYINNGTAVVQVGAGNLSGLGDVAITTPSNGQSLKYNSTTTKWENSTAGTGDVVGPASATDNALVRFDGTTGKLVQNSLGILDDSGNLDVTSAKADYFDFDTTAVTADAVARVAWDDGYGTEKVGLKGGNVNLYEGQQLFVRAYNGSGTAMTKGQIVYIVGAQGNRVDVRLAQANAESTSANTIGMVAEAIAAGGEGFVQVSGSIPKLDTNTLTAGQALYLSPTTAGAYTATKPTAPNHLVVLGWVERVSATVGSIYLKVDNGYELDELHNVNITSATSGNTLIYDATAGYWKNANISAGTGISVTNGAGSITIANTGVTSVSGGTTGLTPATATTGAVTLAGTLAIVNGGTGATTAETARTNLGATTVGGNLFTLTNPSAVTFPRFNADNTVSALDAATFRTAIGAGTSSTTGTVTSVGGTGTVSGLTLSGTVTTSGNLTLGGTFALPSGQVPGKMVYDTFTATASQTTFTTSNTYTSGKIEVYVNGVKLRNGTDVTVTSGTTVVMAVGLAVNSLVDLVYPI